jgi:hypothetical protein
MIWKIRAIFEYDNNGKLHWSIPFQGTPDNDEMVEFVQKKLGKIIDGMIVENNVTPRSGNMAIKFVDGWTVSICPHATCQFLYITVSK